MTDETMRVNAESEVKQHRDHLTAYEKAARDMSMVDYLERSIERLKQKNTHQAAELTKLNKAIARRNASIRSARDPNFPIIRREVWERGVAVGACEERLRWLKYFDSLKADK